MNDQLHCGHICTAAFLAFSGQLRTTSAEDKRKRRGWGERGTGRDRERERERGGGGTGGEREGRKGERGRELKREREGERERIMSAEDNALNTTFRELSLSELRRKTEIIEISM